VQTLKNKHLVSNNLGGTATTAPSSDNKIETVDENPIEKEEDAHDDFAKALLEENNKSVEEPV
jgi:hypothetical protein